MKNTIFGLVMSTVIIVVLVIAIWGVSQPFAIMQCNTWADANPQLEIKYDWRVGCMVRTPSGIWLDASNVNYVNGEITFGER